MYIPNKLFLNYTRIYQKLNINKHRIFLEIIVIGNRASTYYTIRLNVIENIVDK